MSDPVSAAGAPPKNGSERASDAFVTYVLDLCKVKKTQSELRTGLGLPVERCNYLHRYLVPRLPERMHPDARRAHYAVAALIAARPRAAREADTHTGADGQPRPQWYQRANLGASLAEAVNAQIIKPNSAEGDLHLMARQSSEAIHPRLPALTGHLLPAGVRVDWAVLLEDLTWWNRERDRIATRWLEAYFRTTALDTEQDPAASPSRPSEEN
ncbi:type I-E CRISPR-associated protein Cse2/CasB [Streptomyces sp. MS06]|uniref:type I-E CRISPR-associated protein Cse2/CasB n=1 Tax=Streptomyces sp. MS06 TaxID=3385974 RepID=UPI00399FED43